MSITDDQYERLKARLHERGTSLTAVAHELDVYPEFVTKLTKNNHQYDQYARVMKVLARHAGFEWKDLSEQIAELIEQERNLQNHELRTDQILKTLARHAGVDGIELTAYHRKKLEAHLRVRKSSFATVARELRLHPSLVIHVAKYKHKTDQIMRTLARHAGVEWNDLSARIEQERNTPSCMTGPS